MTDNIKVDVILDLSRGDCGKGKVSHSLCKRKGNPYTHTIRFNGGGNAGHTIYHEGKKFVTHQIPAGVFFGIKSIIGPGCVINPTKLLQEVNYLEDNGIQARKLLCIAKNAHVITLDHLIEEEKESSIGTTKTGNGPAYRDKYARVGKRAAELEEFEPILVDMYNEFYDGTEKRILAEGAQGFYLDPDWGDYPYVTSSHCGIGSVLLNGFHHKQIGMVYGVVKAYETYVGARKFEPEDSVFPEIRRIGQEYGATTGRPRQCNWLNLDELKKASEMNGINQLVINKIDVLREVNTWKVIYDKAIKTFTNEEEFKNFITKTISRYTIFSDNPNDF